MLSLDPYMLGNGVTKTVERRSYNQACRPSVLPSRKGCVINNSKRQPANEHTRVPLCLQDASGNSANVFYYNIAVEEVDVLDSIHGSEESLKHDILERNILR